MKNHVCTVCGNKFTSKAFNKKYCSKECQKIIYQKREKIARMEGRRQYRRPCSYVGRSGSIIIDGIKIDRKDYDIEMQYSIDWYLYHPGDEQVKNKIKAKLLQGKTASDT